METAPAERLLLSPVASQKRPRKGSAANWALTKDRTRTGSMNRQLETLASDLNLVRVQHFTRLQNVNREPATQ